MFRNRITHLGMTALLSSTLFFNACKNDDEGTIPVEKPDIAFYGLTNTNQLVMFNAKNAESGSTPLAITGLQGGEQVLGIDFRPATGQLYGVSSLSRLYVINLETGVARAVGTTAFTPTVNSSIVGFDFNPTVDRIRLVTDKGQNLRLNPETGAVAATDKDLNPGMPSVTAVAYTSNLAGAASTTLFTIDSGTDKLYKQDPPNEGTLVEQGALGVDVTATAGFDISPDDKTALAALTVMGKPELYQLDLTTGKATKLGSLGTTSIIGLAIPTNPVAYAVDGSNNLLIFDPTSPAPVSKAIAGLQPNETIVGLDMRPATGQLYALGSSSRLYTLNASSGLATGVGSTSFSTPLSGTDFGFDFNPTVDRIRIVSNTGQNLRVHPETGAIAATDSPLNPGTPTVTAAAYTNNFAGATATVLFDIDTNTDKLYKQDPPNNGTLVEVGALGVNAEATTGFDISGTKGTAYALLTVGGVTKLYTINLQTGAATNAADFPTPVRAMTIGLGF